MYKCTKVHFFHTDGALQCGACSEGQHLWQSLGMFYLREADDLFPRRWNRRGPQEDMFVPLLWFMRDFVGMQEEKNKKGKE